MKQQLSVTLYFRQGSSDKVYQAQIEKEAAGFRVQFQYGRRGSALHSGTKTLAPVPYEKALAVYEALVKSKTGKGYTVSVDGVPYQAPPPKERSYDFDRDDCGDTRIPSRMPVQVLTAISEVEVETHLTDDGFVAQEKFDGERRPVAHRNGAAIGANKLGTIVPLPLSLATVIEALDPGTEVDCEQVGETLWAFDLMRDGKHDVRGLPYIERYSLLVGAISRASERLGGDPNVLAIGKGVAAGELRVAPLAVGTIAKRALYESLKHKEGVVFKRLSSIYKPGIGKNLDQVKFKFVESATVEVCGIHPTRRSVRVQVYDGSAVVPLGSVSIKENVPMPKVGDIIEVRYLYCVDALFQSVYLGPRNDQTRASCTKAQLKYKATP